MTTGLGLSATYTTLLTWLLSLVPDDFTFLRPPDASGMTSHPPVDWPAPFVVLGLQQMFIDGQLVLYVVIKPIQDFDERNLPETVRKTKVRLFTIS